MQLDMTRPTGDSPVTTDLLFGPLISTSFGRSISLRPRHAGSTDAGGGGGNWLLLCSSSSHGDFIVSSSEAVDHRSRTTTCTVAHGAIRANLHQFNRRPIGRIECTANSAIAGPSRSPAIQAFWAKWR